jgi:hypothetical protein
VGGALRGIRVGDDQGGASLTVSLAVRHGGLTLGTTTGLTVTGNGSGAPTLSGGPADLNAALASLTYRGDHNYNGADTLSITASDGSLSASDRLAITVASPARQAADLKARVAGLGAVGALSGDQAHELTARLKLKGNSGDIDKLRSFLDQVEDFLGAGILSRAQAAELQEPGDVLLLSLTRR